ncbi:NAD(P)/FAD-dependent oxidoreductase [Rhizobium sp. AC27/96]|uniref:FAD-dependent oxidoreductase n=1 Tax=Rhizobium sp. AC27/96 TaxID=1841653 RepID=UPI0023B9B018|nr:FAD-dependent monooxygenase [Rhizobium sp. AC27/96]
MTGDAAHIVPQFGGQGANMAMLDALMFSRSLLRADDDMAEASTGYEREMFTHGGKVQCVAAVLQKIFHAPDAANRLSKVFIGTFSLSCASHLRLEFRTFGANAQLILAGSLHYLAQAGYRSRGDLR